MPSETSPLLPEPSSSPRTPRGGHSWHLSLGAGLRKRRDTDSDDDEAVHTGQSPRSCRCEPVKQRAYALYALLVLLGIGIGVSATLYFDKHPRSKPPIMVPPVSRLPPVSDLTGMQRVQY
jgi:hypothetical protein